MKIGVFYKKENKEILDLIKEESHKYKMELDNEHPDVVFSIGGDGTFLKSVHKYFHSLDKILFIGINTGSLGFFYDFVKEDIPSLFKLLNEKSMEVHQYPLLKGELSYKNSNEEIYSINEIRIENPFHTITCDVLINDEMLETYNGNGLIVSSSLGSSGYNKSLGGALIDSELFALELTEVAGIQNRVYRSLDNSLILKGDKAITIKNVLSHAIVGYDHLSINKEDELVNMKISYSDKKVNIVYKEKHNYIQRIRKSFVL